MLSVTLAVLCIYLLLPTLFSGHVEGFTAQIQSLALQRAADGNVLSHDLARPLVSQFVFSSRAGVVDLLAWADGLWGYTADAGFRVLTLLSSAALIAGSTVVARRHGRVPLLVPVFVCALTPGIAELGFFFNDNVVSAGFAALAMAAVCQGGSAAGAVLAGALMAMSVLCRLDGLLAAPLVVTLLLANPLPWRTAVSRLLLMAATAAVVLLLAAFYNGESLLDAIRVSRLFVAKHLNETPGLLPGRRLLQYFFGIPTLALVVIGLIASWKQRPPGAAGWFWLMTFYGYPLVFVMYMAHAMSAVRYFMPLLAPVIAFHGSQGVVALVRAWRGQRTLERRGAHALVAVLVLCVVAPPFKLMMNDGPHAMFGRAWSPQLWTRWQGAVEQSLATADQVAEALARQESATVISASYNDEFYLRLRLFAMGFREAPAGEPCALLSKYVRGSHSIWHVRLIRQYGNVLPTFDEKTAAALMLDAADRCGAPAHTAATWVTSFGPLFPAIAELGLSQDAFPGPSQDLLWPRPGDHFAVRSHGESLRYGLMRAYRLPPDGFQALAKRAHAILVEETARTGATVPAMEAKFLATYRRQ